MVMPDVRRRWTRQEVLDLPEDGNRYELFDGDLLLTPAPSLRHQLAVTRLWERLQPFVAAHRLGLAMPSPADIQLGSGQLAQPDLFVLPDLPASRSWDDAALPLLVVEVLSPATARYDRLVKRRWYQHAQVSEYWIVDIEARVVERWRPEESRPEVLVETLTWAPAGIEPGLTIDLIDFFDRL